MKIAKTDDFERIFNSMYKTNPNEYVSSHKKRYKCLYRIINKINPKKIIDIGESGFTTILKKSEFKVSVLNEKDCNLETDKIPFKDNLFDLVIYTEVIEHLHKNYVGSLKKIYRILKPKGFILFGTPNTKSLWKLLRRGKINELHIREFSMKECSKMLRQANFKILFKRFMLYLDYPKKFIPGPGFNHKKREFLHYIYYHTVKLIPMFRESILILGQK